jgi:hypothetical protein
VGEGGTVAMVVVAQSRKQRDGIFGFLVAVFVVALVRGLIGASTSAGRIAVAVFVTAVLAALVTIWVRVVRRPEHLEVAHAAISLVRTGGPPVGFDRQAGDQLRFVMSGGGRYRRLGLMSVATGTVIPLGFFDKKAVRSACEGVGWRFGSA